MPSGDLVGSGMVEVWDPGIVFGNAEPLVTEAYERLRIDEMQERRGGARSRAVVDRESDMLVNRI